MAKAIAWSSGIVTFLVLWAIAGLIALIMSIYCWAEYPSTEPMADLGGLLIAVLLGPLYWIYYFLKSGYCGRR